jgi:hypothetical protein
MAVHSRKESDSSTESDQQEGQKTKPTSHVRTWFEKQLKDSMRPEELKTPSIGGMLLNSVPEWEDLDKTAQKLIERDMLEFIAQNPLPSNDKIGKEIERLSKTAAMRLIVGDILTQYSSIPYQITVAIEAAIVDFMARNPDTDKSEIMRHARELADEVIMEMALSEEPIFPADAGKKESVPVAVLHSQIVRKILSHRAPYTQKPTATGKSGEYNIDNGFSENEFPTITAIPRRLKP